ncbi:MAG: 16S rRNA (adenine(1518)-N(6)/adenine(1519)-N(6))-dimethyltransferase RsmA [Verrucomicrobiota bacterium]
MKQTDVKKLLKSLGFRPLKSLGQNFLIEDGLCDYIANQITTAPDDFWLEIGPGLGALTRKLLSRNGVKLTAIELDHGLCKYLRSEFAENEVFELIEGDAVKEIATIDQISVVAGNLPYNISTPLLVEILNRQQLPEEIVFTLQKETGERFCARSKTKAYGAITVLLQSCYHVECRRSLNHEVFYPQPNVDSVVFYGKKKGDALAPDLRIPFYKLLRAAFAQRRKKLRNTIGLDSDLRPEHLSVNEWKQAFLTHHSKASL